MSLLPYNKASSNTREDAVTYSTWNLKSASLYREWEFESLYGHHLTLRLTVNYTGADCFLNLTYLNIT